MCTDNTAQERVFRVLFFRVLKGLQCNYLGDVSEMLHLLTEVTPTKPKGLGSKIIIKCSRCHQQEQLWVGQPSWRVKGVG